jgi:L-ascorbate metabolism protein UlaG (beta-lactamase superfamily)
MAAIMIPAFQKDQALLDDIHAASEADDELHLWWLGQSGFLVKHCGQFVLIDPYLSDSLTLKYAATDKPHVRMTERCMAPEQLGFVQLVLSSHQHTDHFDEATLGPLSEVAEGLVGLFPAAEREKVEKRMPEAKIEWWGFSDGDLYQGKHFRVEFVAAAHNEIDRDEWGNCRCLGFIVSCGPFRFYHSGDTLWHDQLLPALLEGPLDLALVPINGNEASRRVSGNLNGTEAAMLAKAAGAAMAVPHHFEGFEFNTASPEEFITACQRVQQPHHVMRCGERLTLKARSTDLL